MELKKILAALKEKELPADVISAVEALDQSSEVERLTKAVESSDGKAAGILEDKKKFKERAEKAEAEILKLKDKDLSADEQTQKQIQVLKDELADEKKARLEEAEGRKKSAREAAETKITSSIQWGKNVPMDTARLVVKDALASVEDLSDEDSVKKVIEGITKTHAPWIDAKTAAGSGGHGGEPAKSSNDDKEYTTADSVELAWSK